MHSGSHYHLIDSLALKIQFTSNVDSLPVVLINERSLQDQPKVSIGNPSWYQLGYAKGTPTTITSNSICIVLKKKKQNRPLLHMNLFLQDIWSIKYLQNNSLIPDPPHN